MTKHPTTTLSITRFHCGCIFRTPVDTVVLCPNHKGRPRSSFITGQERITIPAGYPNASKQLPIDRHPVNRPRLLQNFPSNSIHTLSYITDPDHNPWSDPEAEITGLCAACFIDDNNLKQTRIAICECGDEQCAYRWCGDTTGLHAFWTIHAENRSEELTGISEGHIFSHGAFDDLNPKAREALDAARAQLLESVSRATQQFENARTRANPASHRRAFEPVYLTDWLSRSYPLRTSTPPNRDTRHQYASPRRKLTRLVAAGVLPL